VLFLFGFIRFIAMFCVCLFVVGLLAPWLLSLFCWYVLIVLHLLMCLEVVLFAVYVVFVVN